MSTEWWKSKNLKPVTCNYYGGVVDDPDEVLEGHKRETLSTFGTRTSVKKSILDENQPPDKVLLGWVWICSCG